MTTYDMCKWLINRNRYSRDDMTGKLDILMLNNRITDEQYMELMAMMPVEETAAAEV